MHAGGAACRKCPLSTPLVPVALGAAAPPPLPPPAPPPLHPPAHTGSGKGQYCSGGRWPAPRTLEARPCHKPGGAAMPRSGPAAGGSPPPPQAAARPPAVTPAASPPMPRIRCHDFDDDLRAPRLGDRLAAAAAAACRARRALGTRGGLPRYGIRRQPARVRGSPYRREEALSPYLHIPLNQASSYRIIL